MKRIGRVMVLVGLLLTLVVGCGQPGEQAPGEPGAPAASPDLSPTGDTD